MRKSASRILEVEQGTFTPLVFSTTGGMGEECARYHARLAELLAIKKGETYSTTVSWIQAKVAFAQLRGALLFLRVSRGNRKLTFMRLILKLKEVLPDFLHRCIVYNCLLGGLV